MPERHFDALDTERRKKAIEYVPGYDWVPGKFGPPPGIPKSRKDEFDRMSDKEYLYAFLKLSQEEKESLMVSEAERRRTFAAHWPIESIVKANDCAKEGFYYTGVADRVQCAFCGGIVRNWERGDVPKFQHKNFFNYCKIVQHKPCQNIPLENTGLPQDLLTRQLASAALIPVEAGVSTININDVKPKDPTLSVFSKRRQTFNSYSVNHPVKADKLCDAGFVYKGIEDEVWCFYCGGVLNEWHQNDEPWVEHAKWYPGCIYVQQTKGLEFIKKARSKLRPCDVQFADSLTYNSGDVSFLDAAEGDADSVERLDGFIHCVKLKFKKENIIKAYTVNKNQEYEDRSLLIDIVKGLEAGDNTLLDSHRAKVRRQEIEEAEGVISTQCATPPRRELSVPEMVVKPDATSPDECRNFIDAIRCKICNTNLAGAVMLPCGCFCLCQECSRGNLPQKCPACDSLVRGACRTFLS